MEHTTLHTLILTVEDKPGVLFRISGLIRKRQFNIESLTVSHTITPGISRFTILVDCDEQTVEKMAKQLNRIIEVLEIKKAADESVISRDLALIKVSVSNDEQAAAIQRISESSGSRILERTEFTMIVEISGSESEIDMFRHHLEPFGIIDFARTGRTALIK